MSPPEKAGTSCRDMQAKKEKNILKINLRGYDKMYTQASCPIVCKSAAAKGIFDVTVYCPQIAAEAQPGQFVQVAAEGFFLRRPISICSADKGNMTIRLVFEVRGEGTKKLSEQNTMLDIIGPLGKGFDLDRDSVICVGGGIGVPPMLSVAQAYGERAVAISGFRNASAVILQEDFVRCGAHTFLCTDDGSAGEKGMVTSVLQKCISRKKPELIVACGPLPMLKATAAIAEQEGIACQVSLEQRMACGIGACLVCACRTVKDGREIHSHVCKDGPVFDGREVIW